MNRLTFADLPLELLEVEVLGALLFADQRPLVGAAGLLDWRLDGEVTRMLQARSMSGARGEQLLLQAGDKLRAEWVLLLGAGMRRDCSERQLLSLLKNLWKSFSRAGFSRVGVALPLDLQLSLPSLEKLTPGPDGLSVQLLFVDDAAIA